MSSMFGLAYENHFSLLLLIECSPDVQIPPACTLRSTQLQTPGGSWKSSISTLSTFHQYYRYIATIIVGKCHVSSKVVRVAVAPVALRARVLNDTSSKATTSSIRHRSFRVYVNPWLYIISLIIESLLSVSRNGRCRCLRSCCIAHRRYNLRASSPALGS